MRRVAWQARDCGIVRLRSCEAKRCDSRGKHVATSLAGSVCEHFERLHSQIFPTWRHLRGLDLRVTSEHSHLARARLLVA